MAKVLCGGAQNAVGAGNTGYTGIGLGIHSATTIETLHDQTIRTAGTFSNLSCTVKVNSTGISTLNLRKNLANGNQSISIPSSATGFFEDVSNTDTVVAGDVFDFQLVSGSGGVTTVMPFIVFEADGNTTAIYGGTRAVPFTTDSATRFIAIEARPNAYAETVEAEAQTKIKVAGTWKNMDINVSANNRVSTTTWTSRINGVDGNMLVSVPAGTSGHFEDTSNTDAVSVDDLLAIKMVTGSGGGQLDPETQKTEIEYSGNAFNFPSGTANDTVTTTISNATNFVSPIGGIIAGGVTELFGQIEIPIDSIFSNLLVHVINNSITVSDTTVKVRKNSADGNGLVSIPAGATGFFEDTSNSDSFANGDKLAYVIITPATTGEIGISMISTTEGEIKTDKTFAVNSILEPACDADFCDNFNDYAFQKLPTFRDNFNYSTQASADANWVPNLPSNQRVSLTNENVFWTMIRDGTDNRITFDLGEGVSETNWVLRCHLHVNSGGVLGSPQGNYSIALQDTDVAQLSINDSIGWGLLNSSSGRQYILRDVVDGVSVNTDLAPLGAYTSPDDLFLEMTRISANRARMRIYSDASYSILQDEQIIAVGDVTNLRFLILSCSDDGAGFAGTETGTVDEIEFWNAGQQGDRTFEDNLKQKTSTLSDDFSSYVDQTEADASWAPVGTTIRVNPTTDVMDWDFDKVNANRASAFDLGAGAVSDTNWTLRWKHTYDTVGDTSSSANIGNIGLYDSDETRASSQTQDFVTFKFFKGTNTTTTNFIGLQSGDGIILNDGAGDSSFATQKNPIGGTTLFFELKRTSATTYEGNIYSDANYSVLLDTLQETVASTVTGLRFIKIQNDDRIAIGGGSFNGTLDDIEFWNGNSTLIRWLGRTGNDVGLDIVNSRINFDIPSGVERDELLTHDLQSSLGVNADDKNWTLRFKINTDSITQGSSEEASTLAVGLNDGVLPAHTTGQDHISFLVTIDQGGAGPAFGATTTLRTADNGDYFAGAVGSNFPIAWTTGTLYIELKRLSKTLCECTIYSDADFTEVFTTPQQVTIASTLDNLRFIRITTDSSAVANNSPWDGSIDDIEFYNGVSVPRTPVHETKDFEDTFLADNWTDTGTGYAVNTTTRQIEVSTSLDNTDNRTEFDLQTVLPGSINASDTAWTLRYKVNITSLTSGNGTTILCALDSSTSAQNVADHDAIIGAMDVFSGIKGFGPSSTDGAILPVQGIGITSFTFVINTDYYVELKRTSATECTMEIFTDKDFTNSLAGKVGLTVVSTIQNLRHIKFYERILGGLTGTLVFNVEDVQFWNQQNALDHENKWRKIDL